MGSDLSPLLARRISALCNPPVQQLNRRIASFLAIASVFATVAGCEGAISVGTAEQIIAEPLSNAPAAVDAGVVFADRENYLCLSFEKLGLVDGDSVSTITSSCECIEPSVVSYRSTRGQTAYAVLLRFVKEESKNARQKELEPSDFAVVTPVNLGVLIDVKLADGSDKQFTVNLLHTSLAQEVAP